MVAMEEGAPVQTPLGFGTDFTGRHKKEALEYLEHTAQVVAVEVQVEAYNESTQNAVWAKLEALAVAVVLEVAEAMVATKERVADLQLLSSWTAPAVVRFQPS